MLLWSVRLDFTSHVCTAMHVYSRLKSFPLFPTVHGLDLKRVKFFGFCLFVFNTLNEKLQRPKGCFVVVVFPSCCEGGRILGRFYSTNKHLGLRCSSSRRGTICITILYLLWSPHLEGISLQARRFFKLSKLAEVPNEKLIRTKRQLPLLWYSLT